jgi:hypothetical protein
VSGAEIARRGGVRRRATSSSLRGGALGLAVASLSLVLAAVVGAGPAVAAQEPSAGYVRSLGSVPALPPGSLYHSPVDPASTISFDVSLKPRDPSGLAAFAQGVSTPGSPEFRRFLGPGEFLARFGPEPSTIASVRSWLASKGLSVGETAPDGLLVPVSATAQTVSKAFGVSFGTYRLASGRMARMPSAEPLVPAALAARLNGVVGLDDLARPTPELVRAAPSSTRRGAGQSGVFSSGASGGSPHAAPVAPQARASVAGPQPSCGSNMTDAGLTADQLASAYSFSTVYGTGDEGQGVTVGVFELEPYSSTDISTYENCFTPAIGAAVDPVSVNSAQPNGCGSITDPNICTPTGVGEAALDIEMAASMAPKSKVEVYVGSDAGPAASNAEGLNTYSAMVNQDTAQVISTSWGECERDLGISQINSEQTLFEQAVTQGQTIVAAAGDLGSEDCFADGTPEPRVLQVDDPASQPWVTGVGGTTLSSIGPPPTENVWDNDYGAGGGGVSGIWTQPSWQVGPGVESAFSSVKACPQSSGAGTSSCRQVPDVSSDADPIGSPFAFYWDGSWGGIGGTSMGAPLWAALFALTDQGQSSALGLANPSLYRAGCLASRPFNDVTAGNNQPPSPYLPTDSSGANLGGGPYYPSTTGYDMASGLGTPTASSLLAALRNPDPSACGAPSPCNVGDHAAVAGVSAHSAQVPPTTGLGFTPLSSPVRIADTRSAAADPATYANDTLCPGGALTVDIPAEDVPAGAGAIVAQLTAISPTAPGFLSAFAAGGSFPGTANVNFTTGQIVGNLVTVGLGIDPSDNEPAVTVFNGPTGAGGPVTDFALDLYGYYAPQTSGSGDAYVAITPARIFDTRPGSGQPGAGQTLTNGGSVDVPVTGVGGVPSGASAVVVNIAVTDTSSASFVQGYPTGSPPSQSTPTVNQNWVAGETLSTKGIIGVGGNGSITLANHAGNVDLVVDVDGYFTAPGVSGALFSALPVPVRLLDTRPGGVAGGTSATAHVGGANGVPADASAGVLNVVDIVSSQTDGNFLTVFPSGVSPPLAADVNFLGGDLYTVVDNSSYGTVGQGGNVSVLNGPADASNANVVVDEFGYFSGS